jgi:hypothetical protein
VSRRAYGLLVGVAVVTGVLAVVTSLAIGEPLRDPDGFLGPSWLRLPLMIAGAFLVDVVPRALWRSRHRLATFREQARRVVDEHWTPERVKLVVVGLVSFYVTYVGYRNLKNYLPHVRGTTQDAMLHAVDKALMLGHEPAVLLHQLLGETVAAHVLSAVYLFFIPFAPASLIVWLVWSRNIGYGYWYATAHCLAWALGTLSYYLIPTLGPAFAYVWLYVDLDQTGVASLQDALYADRSSVLWSPVTDSLQSVAGFASLHVGIVLTAALITQYTVRHRWVRRSMWVYFALTVVSTLYFGWHYIADDIGGAVIAVVSVWLGAVATGQESFAWRCTDCPSRNAMLRVGDRGDPGGPPRLTGSSRAGGST